MTKVSASRFIVLCALFLASALACRGLTPAGDREAGEPRPTDGPTAGPIGPATPTFKDLAALAPRGQDAPQAPNLLNLELVWATDDLATVEQPAFFEGQLMGLDVDEVWLVAGGYEAEGRRRLLLLEPQEVEAAGGGVVGQWADGLHRLSAVWPATGLYVTAGEIADLSLLRPAPASRGAKAVEGQLLGPGEDRPLAAELRCDPGGSAPWEIVDGTSGQPFAVQPGDSFQIVKHYLADDGSIFTEPGTEFRLEEALTHGCQVQPLPGGTYFAGWVARDEQGRTELVTADFAVGALEPDETIQTYLDPDAGFQFHYPAGWSGVRLEEERRVASDPLEETKLSVSLHPNAPGISNSGLKGQALSDFGPVDILYEGEVPLAGVQASWTAYGYRAEDGPHTGVLVTFVRNGVGYAVDIDGQAAEEQAILDTISLITSRWAFRAQDAPESSGSWVLSRGDGLSVAIPAEYRRVAGQEEWMAFSSIVTGGLLAVRPASNSGGLSAGRADDWLTTLHPGAADYAASEPYAFSVGKRTWSRVDFAYRSPGGAPIWGLLLMTDEDVRPVLFWAEAPAAAYEALEQEVFLPAAGSLHRTGR